MRVGNKMCRETARIHRTLHVALVDNNARQNGNAAAFGERCARRGPGHEENYGIYDIDLRLCVYACTVRHGARLVHCFKHLLFFNYATGARAQAGAIRAPLTG